MTVAQPDTLQSHMLDAGEDFFMTGGQLVADARSYVTRAADDELYDALARGEFCYVLTSRQMGKSSLAGRTAARLRQGGVRVVSIDLTKFGQNITPEQWYDGMRDRIGRLLRLSDEVDQFWRSATSFGPLQRLIAAITEVVLPRINAPLVVFIDEIDFSRSLPFATDEFFAAIRECYNRRTEDPLLRKLTFCLLGVASPSDLIRDTRTTPFNIGRRIELTDFTATEAMALAEGFSQQREEAPRLLERVLYWTGGHPYLTQRLCREIARQPAVRDAAGVDAAADTLFLSSTARTSDDNLIFVRERLLRSRVDHTALLELYRSVLRGKRVVYHESNVLAEVLRLSGIVRVSDGMLRVRNRIYGTVFDRRWIDANLPSQDRRRQRAAYYRGLARSAAISAVVIATISWLLINQEHLNTRLKNAVIRATASEAAVKRSAADAKLLQAHAFVRLMQRPLDVRRLCAEASSFLAQLHADQTPVYLARSQAEQQFPSPILELSGHTHWATAVAFARDGRHAFSAGTDNGDHAATRMIVWDMPSGRVEKTIPCGGRVNTAAWSDTGELALCACEKHVELIDTGTGKTRWSGPAQKREIAAVAISADGKWALWPAENNDVEVHDCTSGAVVQTLKGHTDSVQCVAVSPDGKRALTGSKDRTLRMWDVKSGEETSKQSFTADLLAVAFSADGKQALSGGRDQWMRLWAFAPTFHEVYRAKHDWPVTGVAFSPKDPKTFATAGNDWLVRVWRQGDEKPTLTFAGHTDPVKSVAFSPDGTMLLSAGTDKSVKLWGLDTVRAESRMWHERGQPNSVAISPDGRIGAFSFEGGRVRLVDLESGRWIGVVEEGAEVEGLAFSPDGRQLALATATGATIRDLLGGKQVPFTGHTGRVTSIAFFHDGRCLTGSLDGTVRTWDAGQGSPAGLILRHGAPVMAVAVDPTGRRILSAGRDWNVKLWDARTGMLLYTFANHTWWATAVAFSPDGHTAVSGGADQHSFLLDVENRRTLKELSRHILGVTAVSYSPDGKYVLTAGDDNHVKIFDAATQQEQCDLDGHSAVKSAAFTPAGAAPPDGPCILWALKDGTVMALKYGRLDRWDGLRADLNKAVQTLATSPDDAAATATLGRWYAFRGLPDAAVTLLEKAKQRGAHVEPTELAQCYWQKGIPFYAAQQFRQTLARSSGQEAIYLQLCLNELEVEMHGGSPQPTSRPATGPASGP